VITHMAASHPLKSIMGRTTDPGENRDPCSAIGALRSGSLLTASKAHKPSIRSLTGKPRLENRSYTTPWNTTLVSRSTIQIGTRADRDASGIRVVGCPWGGLPRAME
jgi:hypothetical protein